MRNSDAAYAPTEIHEVNTVSYMPCGNIITKCANTNNAKVQDEDCMQKYNVAYAPRLKLHYGSTTVINDVADLRIENC